MLPLPGPSRPYGVAVDTGGNLYITYFTDSSNRVLKLADGGTPIDLPFTGLNYPVGVAVDRALADSSGIVITTPLLEWTAAQIAALRGDWPAAAAAVRNASAVNGDYEMMVIPTLLARPQIAEAEADYAKSRSRNR